MTLQPAIPAQRVVVLMPNWLGDAVMATPFLRALRGLYPQAFISALHIPLVGPVLYGLPYVNEAHEYHKEHAQDAVYWMRDNHFDLAVLLPNSFRSAWMVFSARVPRRLGYAREWRSILLTDRARPLRRTGAEREYDRNKSRAIHELGGPSVAVGSTYTPVPTIDYYLGLATRLRGRGGRGGGRGAGELTLDRRMELAVTDAERAAAEQALASVGLSAADPTLPGNRSAFITNPLVVLVPGANFGSSKCWSAERFAELTNVLTDPTGRFHATVLIASSPAEQPIVDAIMERLKPHATQHKPPRVVALANAYAGRGVTLGALKEIVRRSRLMVCNDTGPRHFAVAFSIPVVTLFGPTDPRWAETYYPREKRVTVTVPCGPCQLKQCPIDHRCMEQLSVDAVLDAVRELWR